MIPLPFFELPYSKIPFLIMLAGSAVMAVLCVMFFWSFAEYIFFKGNDAERAHAKMQLLTATTRILLLMIVWLICDWIAGFFGIR